MFRASDKVTLAADVVQRYRNVFGDLALHSNVPEVKGRSATADVRIRISNARSRTRRSTGGTIARSIALARQT